MTMVEGLKVFAPMFILSGGGPNNATRSISLLIYQEGLQNLRMGSAAAMSVIGLVFVLLIIVVSCGCHGQRRRRLLAVRIGVPQINLTSLVRVGLLAGFAVVTLFPIAWIVSGSLKPLEQVFSLPVQWIPDPFVIANYPDAMRQANFLRPCSTASS